MVENCEHKNLDMYKYSTILEQFLSVENVLRATKISGEILIIMQPY